MILQRTFRLLRQFPLRKMSTDSANEVLFCREGTNGRVGIITLNRPKALNALNLNMVELLTDKLEDWEKEVKMIVIRGAGDKAFCAGGDVVSLTKEGPGNCCLGKEFFRKEYFLDYLTSRLKVPYIALIDGITMGGGVGLSIHGRYRIATERTLFAMPETAIGLIPDVGASYVLSRMPGGLGAFLGLTGHRLKGADLVKAGIATHFIPSGQMPDLVDALVHRIDPDDVCKGIESLTKSTKSTMFSLDCHLDMIDRIFTLPTIPDIMQALKKEGSEWSVSTLATLNKMSPVSLVLTLKLLQEAKSKTLAECFVVEYRLATASCSAKISPDFYEGVRALLIDKDKKPKWSPPVVEAVTEAMVKAAFAPLSPSEELVLN